MPLSVLMSIGLLKACNLIDDLYLSDTVKNSHCILISQPLWVFESNFVKEVTFESFLWGRMYGGGGSSGRIGGREGAPREREGEREGGSSRRKGGKEGIR